MVKSKYQYISGKQLIKYIDEIYGVKVVGQKGSHIKIQNIQNARKTIIPNHRELAYGTFSAILHQLQIDENEFLEQILK